MPFLSKTQNISGIEFRIIYSRRRSIGISVLPDASVIVRAPLHTTDKTINRLVAEKAGWIMKHRDTYQKLKSQKIQRLYTDGAMHLFRGKELKLKVERSFRSSVHFNGSVIELHLPGSGDERTIKNLLYRGYKNEAAVLFPVIFNSIIKRFEGQMFRPSGLVIRTMKRRWGSCSSNGIITLSTELIKLPDLFLEYVIIHELCHLKHHNHSARFYNLLSELFPDWKIVRKELREYTVIN